VGVVSDHDIGREVMKGPEGLQKTVGSLMSDRVVTTNPEASVLEAALVMHNRRFGCLPVVDGEGRLVGILSRNDLLEVLVSQLQASGD
jgi:CBS domain-containing protein